MTKYPSIKPGITFLPFGLFLLISGIGRSGWVWESYSAWQPFSTISVALISILVAIPLYKKFKIALFSSPSPEEIGLKSFVAFIIIMIGIPIVSVSTRELTMIIDPMSLYIGLAICTLIIINYGFDLPLIVFSLIFFASMFLPLLNQKIVASNKLNDNMLEPFTYSLGLGIYFLCWGILSVLRHQQSNEDSPVISTL